jgi:hypothetical protein
MGYSERSGGADDHSTPERGEKKSLSKKLTWMNFSKIMEKNILNFD